MELASMNQDIKNIAYTLQPQSISIVSVDSRGNIESKSISLLLGFLRYVPDYRGIAVYLTLSGQQVEKRSDFIGKSEFGKTCIIAKLHTTSDQLLFHQRSEQLRSLPDVIVSTADRFLVHLKVGNIDPKNIGLVLVEDLQAISDAGYIRDLQKIYQHIQISPARWILTATSCNELVVGRIRGWLAPEQQVEVLHFNDDNG